MMLVRKVQDMAGASSINSNNSWIEKVLEQTKSKDVKSLNLYSLATIASIKSNISAGKELSQAEGKSSIKKNYLEQIVLSTLNTKFDSVIIWTDKIRDACK